MKPNNRFTGLPLSFWADVRLIGESIGYTVRKEGIIRVPTIDEINWAYNSRELSADHLFGTAGPTNLGHTVLSYFKYRARILNEYVEPRLMDVDRAKVEFEKLHQKFKPRCPIPMNKQKKEKRAPAYLTGIVNMLIEEHSKGIACDYDPRRLTAITRDRKPVRTLARRVDGAFPSTVNPVAVWEIKEYYYTTTFGSRVADGVYETLLDGMELAEIAKNEDINVLHYLIVDAHYTWWNCGRSYLCRMVDMIHMGYVDEVLFGYEVIERLPGLITEWVEIVQRSTS